MANRDDDQSSSITGQELVDTLAESAGGAADGDDAMDPAVDAVGKRFRRAALQQTDTDEPSLDAQVDPEGLESASTDVLERDVAEALKSEPKNASARKIRDTNTGVGEPSADFGQMPGAETGNQRTDAETGGPAADARQAGSQDASNEAEEGKTCPECDSTCPPGVQFCVQCGTALTDEAESQTERSIPELDEAALDDEVPEGLELVTIADDGSDGTAIPIQTSKTILGRDGDARFPTDEFLNPNHARLTVEDNSLYLEDLDTLNGTYLKLNGGTGLEPGDTFLMGQQVLRFEAIREDLDTEKTADDGTRYMGSPAPGGDYKILQIGVGEIVQNVYCLPEDGVVLGREKGDILFPQDKFMSGRHAQVEVEDGSPTLTDLNSSNGTWLKMWEKVELEQNDYLFMGQQLFRVEVPS